MPAPSPPIASRARTGGGLRRQAWWLLGSLVGLATLGGFSALLGPLEASHPSAPPVELAVAKAAHVETVPSETDESPPSPTPTAVEPRAAMPHAPAEPTPLPRRTDPPPVRHERRRSDREEGAAATTSETEAKPTPGTPPLAPPPQPAAPSTEKLPAAAPTPRPPTAAPKTRPKRVAFNGKLLTESETERYFAARDTGATEAQALQIAVMTPVDPGPTPLPRRVAYNGRLLNDAESRRYFVARDAGLDHDAAARTALKETPATTTSATAAPLYRGPLPANLPKRVAVDGKLLSIEETEQYFREKLAQNPPGDH